MAKRKTVPAPHATAPNPPFAPTLIGEVLCERNQSHPTRKALFEQLENSLGRPVVTFFTSFGRPAIIDDADAEVLEDILRRTDLSKGLALVISSPGGNGLAAERIVKICRSYSGTGEYLAIVPGKAKSAATMICFGASGIILGPGSELGPVDPQLVFDEDGKRKQLSAHNIVRSYDTLFADAVKSRGNLEPYLQQLSHYDPREIQWYRELIELSDDISVSILNTGMMRNINKRQIRKQIGKFLKPEHTKSHARPIFVDDARGCGLTVEEADTSGPRWAALQELYVRTNMFVSGNVVKSIESKETSFAAQFNG